MSLKTLNQACNIIITTLQKDMNMKLLTLFAICLLSVQVYAGIQAVTDEGKIVILNKDGTWQYQDNEDKEIVLETNPKNFTKNNKASFQIKSNVNNSSFWINTKKWTFTKNKNTSEPTEYSYKFKKGDLYGMSINEAVQIDVEEFVKIAFNNAKSAAPDMKVVRKEYRMINGRKVIFMEMKGTMQSLSFTYYGYYSSNESGVTQHLVYTGTNLVAKFSGDMENFLNGLSLQ